ncbi:MAG: hypothetical protein V7K47_06775 [Nostoc sp.]
MPFPPSLSKYSQIRRIQLERLGDQRIQAAKQPVGHEQSQRVYSCDRLHPSSAISALFAFLAIALTIPFPISSHWIRCHQPLATSCDRSYLHIVSHKSRNKATLSHLAIALTPIFNFSFEDTQSIAASALQSLLPSIANFCELRSIEALAIAINLQYRFPQAKKLINKEQAALAIALIHQYRIPLASPTE